MLDDLKGVVELTDVAATARPLIIRSPLGFGQIVFVAFDLELPSIADWEGRADILGRVLQTQSSQPDRRRGEATNTQVQDSVIRTWWVNFGRTGPIPASEVGRTLVGGGTCLLYIVVIGPVDYFSSRRFRRMTLHG